MMRKNGAPNQILTRMTEKRAQPGWLSQGTSSKPMPPNTQLNAECVGSNSHHQPSDDSARGITQGTSSMPRHLRWPLVGRLLMRCAVIRPMTALKKTADSAKIADCQTTVQKTSRESR